MNTIIFSNAVSTEYCVILFYDYAVVKVLVQWQYYHELRGHSEKVLVSVAC